MVHPPNKYIQSSFTHPHVISNLCDFLSSVEHKVIRDFLKKVGNQIVSVLIDLHCIDKKTMEVNGNQNCLVWKPRFRHWLKKKKGYCDFLSHNLYFFLRIVRYKLAIARHKVAILRNNVRTARYKLTILRTYQSFFPPQNYITQFWLYNSQLRVYVSQFCEKKVRIER